MPQIPIELGLLRPPAHAPSAGTTPPESRPTTPCSNVSTAPTLASSSPDIDPDRKSTQEDLSPQSSTHLCDPSDSAPSLATTSGRLSLDPIAEPTIPAGSVTQATSQPMRTNDHTGEHASVHEPDVPPSLTMDAASIPVTPTRQPTPDIEDTSRPSSPRPGSTSDSSSAILDCASADDVPPPNDIGSADMAVRAPSRPSTPLESQPLPAQLSRRPSSSEPGSDTPGSDSSGQNRPNSPPPRPPTPEPVHPQWDNPFEHRPSTARMVWERMKTEQDEETSDVIDKLMRLEGLEDVKNQFLDIKSKVDLCKEQDRDLEHERFNIVYQGNPGTGKTTVARLYAEFLHATGIVGSGKLKETSGIKLCAEGPQDALNLLKRMVKHGDGGVLFVDEAYQLTAPYLEGVGRQVLDIILTFMENNIGKFAVIFVGYKDEMESFYEHNPGLSSRIPLSMTFADFSDAELWKILHDNINRQYKGKMKVEEGMDGRYMRIVVRRLGYARGSRGFGNARAVENMLSTISHRQARRITRERREGQDPDPLLFVKEDLIGPEPLHAAERCPAWTDLQHLIGLESVKECVRGMLRMSQLNYKRELAELRPMIVPLNQLFVGNPGTGKTTVAKLYGQILAEIGVLSRGDVVLKTPPDFIGECLGKSEAKTKKILEATVGKVLVIDEAYMLDAGDKSKDQDKFKTGVIDTLVSMVQGVPGEDRCIIFVGYEDKISDMFQNVNPGLSRRFPINRPFRFENFDVGQLRQILQKKMREDDIEATPEALQTAHDVLERALMRPNCSNAGEVDSILGSAKLQYERRQAAKPAEAQAFDGKLEPADFDKHHDRGTRTGVNTRQELGGLVHDSIIEKLATYQARCQGARMQGLRPRDHVPTNFVFKGFPGTGKTTVAQHMGKIFYGMGFLGTWDVVECSATDLLGQYVGQTCPKTRKVLEKALGKTLFIDEAYRLVYGQYADEAAEEIIQFLAKPSHAGKMVVILAGYKLDMNLLMTKWPVLSGLFQEEIEFENLSPEESIGLLFRELRQSQVDTDGDFLHDASSAGYNKVKRLFHALQVMPSWGNARDIQYLANRILGKFLESARSEVRARRVITLDQVLDCLLATVIQRRDRSLITTSSKNGGFPEQPPIGTNSAPILTTSELSQPPPAAQTSVYTAGATTTSTDVGAPRRSASHGQVPAPVLGPSQRAPTGSSDPAICARGDRPAIEHDAHRAQGGHVVRPVRERQASEEEWADLQAAKTLADEQKKQRGMRSRQLERDLAALEEARAGGGDAGWTPGDLDARRGELRDGLSAIQRSMQSEHRTQKRLKAMSRCVNGYAWVRLAGGWRCEGGAHFVSDSELGGQL